jgi:DNA primase
LPEGQDPDDLARSGGRGAIEEVISAARGLADVIWSREIEGGTYATPERRAALEARIGELSGGIRDEVVRRYYRQDLRERLQRTFAPEVARGGYTKGNFRGAGGNFGGESGRRFAPRGVFTPGAAGRFEPRGGRAQGPAGSQTINRGPYQAASPQLATSPIMRGQRSAISRREALILQSLINHPWLLHDHLEEVAALELAHPEAHKLRAGIINAFAHYSHTDDVVAETARLHASLEKSGYSEQIQRVERALTTKDVWGAQPGAAIEDVLSTWRQLIALHQKTHALLSEKKDAELALSQDPTDNNFGWLKDVSARLESIDGTEALIEGFGESSGRFQRSV